MRIIYSIVIILLIASCSKQESATESNLSGTKTYFYSSSDGIEQVRVVHTAFRDEQLVSYYVQIIERKYDLNGNITSQITYDVKETDTIFHDFIGKIFDNKNRLIRKTDSMKMMNIKEENKYKNENLEISSTKIIYSNGDSINGKSVWIPIDSSMAINRHFYTNGKGTDVVSLNQSVDQMKLSSGVQPDSIFTYNRLDINGNKIESVTISAVDTLYVKHRKFDAMNREVELKTVRNDTTILSSYKRKFDDRNNKIFEEYRSENSWHRTEFIYNDSSQLIQEKWYQLD